MLPLLEAAVDLRYLLGRGYGREAMLTLVGNRWSLPERGRRLLRRGVFSPEEARSRGERLCSLRTVAGNPVAVDGHNVLITLENALSGNTLVMADDTVVRDIAEIGRNHKPGPLTTAAARLMLDGLSRAGAKEVRIFLDAPLPRSRSLAAAIEEMMREKGLAGTARAVASPERELAGFPGFVATSDHVILDTAARPLDLAGRLIATFEEPVAMEKLK